MRVSETDLPGVKVIHPTVHADQRGAFLEAWSCERYRQSGIAEPFVQDNLSISDHAVLRGLHLQHPQGQGKLVSVVQGAVFDVAVDVRVGSPHFGKWFGLALDDRERTQLYIPPGFAHGFCVTSETAIFAYKCTSYYHAESEVGVRWDDPALAIPWPVTRPRLSVKDASFPRLAEIPHDRLPTFS